ncbi:MAG: gamma-glutamylcyclotransferase family protein [Promethearchaeota archaeon]
MSTDFISIIGYGTFITHGFWKDKRNVEVCVVKNFIRIFIPERNWFPYALPLKNSFFKALKFEVTKRELEELDIYEGVNSGLFKRLKTEVVLKNDKQVEAFIYIPTTNTIISQRLTSELDRFDSWKKEIENSPEVLKKFPELLL